MAATISQLSSSNTVLRWKLHKSPAIPPSATALFTRQVFCNNIITFPMYFNRTSLKLSVSTTSTIHKCHAITAPCNNIITSNLQEVDDHDHVKKLNVNCSDSCSSIFKIFRDHNVVSMQILVTDVLKSILVYGVIVIMTMAMTLCTKESALAASYGRMGGSSSSSGSSKSSSSSSRSSSSQSSKSSSSSSRSSSYRSSSSRSSSYRSSSSSTPSNYISSSYDYRSSLSESEPLSYSRNESSTIGTIICNCNCSKENQNKPLNPSSCTNCNCNKEGAKLDDSSTNNEENNKTTPSTCNCKCHCACDCHKEKEVKNQTKSSALTVILALAALGAIVMYLTKGRGSGSVVITKGGGSGSVVMVQVGIADKNRVLQKRLNEIADSADTSTVDGLNYVLKEVVKALLKHYDSCHFAYFYDKYGSSMNNSIRPRFEELLNREINRHDKDENTFVNVDGVKYEATVADKANSADNEYSVVTLLVLASEFQLNESLNRSIGNMKLLLQKILFIPRNNIESVEVLWTPQREDETVLEQEIRKDFPLMSTF